MEPAAQHTLAGSAPSRDLEIAHEFVRLLSQRCDPTSVEVTLYGSRARGNPDPESDLDIFVALNRDDPRSEAKAAAREIACDLTLKHGVLVSVFVADASFLARHKGYSFLEAVTHEGVRV